MIIQWYPGHMTKTKRMMMENISLVDIVIELLDARIPASSKNPDIDVMAKDKKRIVLLNKSDLADAEKTKRWMDYFEQQGKKVILTNSKTGKGLKEIWEVSQSLMAEKLERLKQRGRIFTPIRAMIVGIPNVGKSTLINQCVGKSITATGDRPGVTRTKQWVRIRKDFELLDTPGILWPKFEDETVGLHLAFTGAIKDEIMDTYTLGEKLCEILQQTYTSALTERYGITPDTTAIGAQLLEQIGEKRGFKLKGGVIDTEKAAQILLDEFRSGKLGKITLEVPESEK